jgi:transposase
MFVRFAIDVLLATQTVAGASSLLRTNWDKTWYLLEKAVERGRTRKLNTPMPRIGIDEKAFRKGHNYITLIYDLERSSAKAISDGNDIHAANTAFSQLSEDQLARAHAIAMDMSAA